MALRAYALLKRREAAKTAEQSGKEVEPVRYTLRTPEGDEVGEKEARTIIKQKYARDVVAPERAAKDRSRKKSDTQKKKAVVAVSDKNGWPSKDATIGKTATPPKEKVDGSASKDNRQVAASKKSEPVLLADIIEESLKTITSESLKTTLNNLLKRSEMTS